MVTTKIAVFANLTFFSDERGFYNNMIMFNSEIQLDRTAIHTVTDLVRITVIGIIINKLF